MMLMCLQVGAGHGEQLLGTWPPTAGPIEPTFRAILEHLDKEGLSPSQAASLSGAPFIPVAHASRLVAPSRLFLRLREDLAPFAYEVPAAFAGQGPLLRLLGAREEPSVADLVGGV